MVNLKKRSNRGFTLVEMLCTIVILILMSGLMATGIKLGVESLRKCVIASESQVLCSTLRELVSDELRYAGTVNTEGSTIAFFSQNFGKGDDEKGLSFSSNDDGQVLLGTHKLLPKKSYPYGIKATVKIESYNKTTRIFTATVIVTDKNDKELDSSEFQAKKLNP